MQMFRTRNGPGNKSRIEDMVAPFVEQGARGEALIPAAGAQFRRTVSERASEWHPAPRRQLIVWLSGREEIVAGDGSVRSFSPGDLFLADDTTGEGHIIRNHGESRRLWVAMPDWDPAAGVSPLPAVRPAAISRGPQFVRVFTGADGKSHLEPMEWQYLEQATSQAMPWIPVTGVQFRRWASEATLDFHTAPRRQLIVTLSGEAEVETGDGTKLRFLPGDVLLAEDTTGQGHISRYRNDRRAIFIPLGEVALARAR